MNKSINSDNKPQIVVIGDSISDYGFGTYRYTHPLMHVSAYVQSQMPNNDAGYCYGRYLDSINWTEIFSYYFVDAELYNYATGGSSLSDPIESKSNKGNDISHMVVYAAYNYLRSKVSSHIDRQIQLFKDDYSSIINTDDSSELWVILMAGGNDLIYDDANDSWIAQKLAEKSLYLSDFLTAQNHKNFKVFVIPTILYICPNLFYMDWDGRNYFNSDYRVKGAYEKLLKAIKDYKSNKIVKEKVTVLNFLKWAPEFKYSDVDTIYYILSTLFETPFERDKYNLAELYYSKTDFHFKKEFKEIEIVFNLIFNEDYKTISQETLIYNILKDCVKKNNFDNLICKILTMKIPLSCQSYTTMSNHYEDTYVKRNLSQEVVYKLIGGVMFYNRLENISENQKEILDLQFYDLDKNLKLKIHSMADGILQKTHCLHTVDLGEGLTFDFRQYYSNTDSYHLLSRHQFSIAEYMYKELVSLNIIKASDKDKSQQTIAGVNKTKIQNTTCSNREYFVYKSNLYMSRMTEGQLLFSRESKNYETENYKCFLSSRYQVYQHMQNFPNYLKLVSQCNRHMATFKLMDNPHQLSSDCVLINDLCLAVENRYYIKYNTNWCKKNNSNILNTANLIFVGNKEILNLKCK